MDRMLYVSMSGAKEVMLSQANNANNLANASTDGFKQDFNEFRAQHVQGPGWESRAFSLDERPATDFSAGTAKVTGRELDVMTKQNGFMAVLTPAGDEGLIRTASMQLTPEGDLVDIAGNPVLNTGGIPINIPPSRSIVIGDDGTISIVPDGSPSNELVILDQLRLVEPDMKALTKGEDGFIRPVEGTPALAQGNIKVLSGALETSNVNTAEALVNMIELSRKYEMQIKMMSTAKNHAQKSDSILSLR